MLFCCFAHCIWRNHGGVWGHQRGQTRWWRSWRCQWHHCVGIGDQRPFVRRCACRWMFGTSGFKSLCSAVGTDLLLHTEIKTRSRFVTQTKTICDNRYRTSVSLQTCVGLKSVLIKFQYAMWVVTRSFGSKRLNKWTEFLENISPLIQKVFVYLLFFNYREQTQGPLAESGPPPSFFPAHQNFTSR